MCVPPPAVGRTAVRLSPSRTRQDPTRAGVDGKPVRVDRAGDHRLPQAGAGVDHRLPPPAGHRVGGEQHPRGGRVHHPLHHHREPDLPVVDAGRGAVGDRPIRPQRRPAPADRLDDPVRPDHVQIGVLLAGEAGVGQVLRGRRGPHRDGHVLAQREVAVPNSRRDIGGHLSSQQHGAGPHRQLGPVAPADQLVHRTGDRPIGLGGDDEPVGHREPRADQLAEIRRLPPTVSSIPAPSADNGTTTVRRRPAARSWARAIAMTGHLPAAATPDDPAG